MKSKEFSKCILVGIISATLFGLTCTHADPSHSNKLTSRAIAAMLPAGARIVPGAAKNEFFILGKNDTPRSIAINESKAKHHVLAVAQNSNIPRYKMLALAQEKKLVSLPKPVNHNVAKQH